MCEAGAHRAAANTGPTVQTSHSPAGHWSHVPPPCWRRLKPMEVPLEPWKSPDDPGASGRSYSNLCVPRPSREQHVPQRRLNLQKCRQGSALGGNCGCIHHPWDPRVKGRTRSLESRDKKHCAERSTHRSYDLTRGTLPARATCGDKDGGRLATPLPSSLQPVPPNGQPGPGKLSQERGAQRGSR